MNMGKILKCKAYANQMWCARKISIDGHIGKYVSWIIMRKGTLDLFTFNCRRLHIFFIGIKIPCVYSFTLLTCVIESPTNNVYNILFVLRIPVGLVKESNLPLTDDDEFPPMVELLITQIIII